jgi:hypothetical protein
LGKQQVTALVGAFFEKGGPSSHRRGGEEGESPIAEAKSASVDV